MLALQHQPNVFGLSAEGQPATPLPSTSDGIAERIARMRRRILLVGLAGSIVSGVTTASIAGGAFSLARTERVFAPAAYLGAVAALPLLLATIVATVKVDQNTEGVAQTSLLPPTDQPPAPALGGLSRHLRRWLVPLRHRRR